MPKKAITMGIKTILTSRRIVVLVSGAVKHEALKSSLRENHRKLADNLLKPSQ